MKSNHIEFKKKIIGIIVAFALFIPIIVPLVTYKANVSVLKNYNMKAVNYKFSDYSKIIISTEKERENNIYGYIITFYAIGPDSKPIYIGVQATYGNILNINNTYIKNKIFEINNIWLKSIQGDGKGIYYSLILFIDLLTFDGFVKVYIVTVPINIYYLNLYKNFEIYLTLTKPINIRSLGLIPKNRYQVNEDVLYKCIEYGCSEGICTCYCSVWQSDEEYGSIGWHYIPVLMTKLAGYANKVETVTHTIYLYEENIWEFGVHLDLISIIDGEYQYQYIDGPSLYFDFNETNVIWDEDIKFRNSRYYSHGRLFSDKAILSIGIYGDAYAGHFIRYEKICECGFCDETPWQPTNDEADILISKPKFYYDHFNHAYVILTSYEIDDDPEDGNGFLEEYFNWIFSNNVFQFNYPSFGQGDVAIHNSFANHEHYSFTFGFSVIGLLTAVGFSIPISSSFGVIDFYGKGTTISFVYGRVEVHLHPDYEYSYVSLSDATGVMALYMSDNWHFFPSAMYTFSYIYS